MAPARIPVTIAMIPAVRMAAAILLNSRSMPQPFAARSSSADTPLGRFGRKANFR